MYWRCCGDEARRHAQGVCRYDDESLRAGVYHLDGQERGGIWRRLGYALELCAVRRRNDSGEPCRRLAAFD